MQHILQWARDQFEGLFRQPVETAQQFLNDPKFIDRISKQQGAQPVSRNLKLFLTLSFMMHLALDYLVLGQNGIGQNGMRTKW